MQDTALPVAALRSVSLQGIQAARAASSAFCGTTATLAAAAATLIALQDEYRAWLDNLTASLDGSRLAEKLQANAEPDL
jgi:hypothetical protein